MKRWQFLLGLIVSAFFLWLALQGLHLEEVWQDLQEGNYLWLIPSVGVYFLAVLARTWRWDFMLRPLKRISIRRLFPVVVIGYMGNNIYPFRAGELLRSYVLYRREDVPVGSSLATVVVEGRVRSGSLISARLAGEFGRMVFAVPGRVDSDLSRGPHALIRDGAVLVESAEQVLLDLGYRPLTDTPTLPPPADPLQRTVLALLDSTEPRGMDDILLALENPAPAVLAALLSLELAGWARALPGRRFVCCAVGIGG